MKTSELRIGNYVNVIDDNGKIKGVDTISNITLSGWETLLGYEGIKPIPLTEEGLLKCGYIKVGEGDFRLRVKSVDIYGDNNESEFGVCFLGDGYFIVRHDNHGLCYIKYLHQLQNLYFALTGKELLLNRHNGY